MADITRLDAPLIVGAGVAGLTVALGLERAFVISSPERGSTWWAQGGIAAAVDAADSPSDHAADTFAASAGLAVEEAVDALTRGGPAAIERLVAMGAEFDRDPLGNLELGREGGHQRRRVVHADGDATGAEVMRALHAAVEAQETVTLIEGTVLDLVRSGDRVVGVVARSEGARRVFLAPAVVLASGGAGRLFLRTTNPPGVNGDGIMLAARAGAVLADLEFVQFHPTALLAGVDPMPLLTEALRGEGARLVDADGHPVMDGVHPMGDLGPRDVVARTIFAAFEAGTPVFLDARSVTEVRRRFPTATAFAAAAGLDPATDALPVSPAAHYFMGGIDADDLGRSSVPGLWAVGECSSTGVHGANRLASNSLLEGLVFGARVAADVDEMLEAPPEDYVFPEDAFALPLAPGPEFDELRAVMWERVGLIRSSRGLAEARRRILDLRPALDGSIGGRNAADLALLMCRAAELRRESRGGHFRSDFPLEDPEQARRSLMESRAVAATAGAMS